MKKYVFLVFIVTLILLSCDRFSLVLPPEADFTQDVDSGFAPLEVQFIDQSQERTNPIISWYWDFNNDQIIDSEALNPLYTFNEPGEYLVSLTVSDGDLSHTKIDTISVYEPGPPIAAFCANPEEGIAPLLVQFTDESLEGDNPILIWEWDFDNDQISDSEEQNPQYTFHQPGKYPVTLTISDGFFVSSYIDTINVFIYSKILVELATGIWCNGCPFAEEALHNLKSEFGDQFYYLEYHISDELEVNGNSRDIQFYGISGLTAAVFQGITTISVGNENTEEIYRNALLSLFEQEADVIIYDFGYIVSRDQLDCSVSLIVEPFISMTDLMLKFSLIEIESEVLNYDGNPCLQVPLVNGELNLDEYDLSQPVDFSIVLPEIVPEDISLIIWVQTIEDTYDSETCKIYNVIEEEIIIGR